MNYEWRPQLRPKRGAGSSRTIDISRPVCHSKSRVASHSDKVTAKSGVEHFQIWQLLALVIEIFTVVGRFECHLL